MVRQAPFGLSLSFPFLGMRGPCWYGGNGPAEAQIKEPNQALWVPANVSWAADAMAVQIRDWGWGAFVPKPAPFMCRSHSSFRGHERVK